jgi:hypothetical protein
MIFYLIPTILFILLPLNNAVREKRRVGRHLALGGSASLWRAYEQMNKL